MAPLSDGSILGRPSSPPYQFLPLFVPDLIFPWAFQPVLSSFPGISIPIFTPDFLQPKKSPHSISKGIQSSDLASAAIDLCRDVVNLLSKTESRLNSKSHLPPHPSEIHTTNQHDSNLPKHQSGERCRQRRGRRRRRRRRQVRPKVKQVWRPVQNPRVSQIESVQLQIEPVHPDTTQTEPNQSVQVEASSVVNNDEPQVVNPQKSPQQISSSSKASSKLRASAPSFSPGKSLSHVHHIPPSPPKSFSSFFGIPEETRSDQELIAGVVFVNPRLKFAKPSFSLSKDDSSRVYWDDESGRLMESARDRILPLKYISKTLDDFGDSRPEDVKSLSEAIKMWKLEARKRGLPVRKKSTRNKKVGFPVAKKPGKSINYQGSRDPNFYYY